MCLGIISLLGRHDRTSRNYGGSEQLERLTSPSIEQAGNHSDHVGNRESDANMKYCFVQK